VKILGKPAEKKVKFWKNKESHGSVALPYWLSGALLPDVWSTAGKYQADSREESGS